MMAAVKNYMILITIILASIMSLAYLFGSKKTMEESLVGHWTFDEKEGSTIIDYSKFASHGEIKRNPMRASGIVGKGSLEFDGEDDYIEILENGKTPSQLHNLDKGSISIWFQARNIPIESSILPVFYYGSKNGCDNMKDASNEGLVIEIAHGSIIESQGVFFTIFNNPCERPSICFDTHSESHPADLQGMIKEGEWYHFVAVVGENYNTGYLNGEEIVYRHYNFNNANASQFFKNSQKHERMWIGKGFWNYAKETYFDGYIDDLRIYDIPLSSKQVKKLFDMKNAD